MEQAEVKYMIGYDTEEEREHYRYKEVIATRPDDVSYENGMYTFTLLKYIPREVNGKKYYALVDNDKQKYAFGYSETCKRLIERMKNGENFVGDTLEGIQSWAKSCGEESTLWVTGTNALMMDYFTRKVPVKSVNPSTPDLEVAKDDFVEAHLEWYVRYKKKGDDTWYYKPTFCSDKKFRNEMDSDIESYQFVEVAIYEINGKRFEELYRVEDKVYENNNVNVHRDETDAAIDGAISVLFGNETDKMFEGYTRIYPFNTEDGASVCHKHQDNIKNQDALTITGSGDFMLDLFLYGAKSVTCFDINGLAKYYALLKFSFIKAGMSYKDYKEFFLGQDDIILKRDLYEKYKGCLDERVQRFWDAIYTYLENNNKQLHKSEHNLMYKIYDMFGSANRSYNNKSSYFTEANFGRLQEILKSKSLENIRFYDASITKIPEILHGQKFGYAYLSNVIDFTDQLFNSESQDERIKMFKDFILVEFTNLVRENGAMSVGYISAGWDTNLLIDEYNRVFTNEEGFAVESLAPYNNDDSVLSYGRTYIYAMKSDGVTK